MTCTRSGSAASTGCRARRHRTASRATPPTPLPPGAPRRRRPARSRYRAAARHGPRARPSAGGRRGCGRRAGGRTRTSPGRGRRAARRSASQAHSGRGSRRGSRGTSPAAPTARGSAGRCRPRGGSRRACPSRRQRRGGAFDERLQRRRRRIEARRVELRVGLDRPGDEARSGRGDAAPTGDDRRTAVCPANSPTCHWRASSHSGSRTRCGEPGVSVARRGWARAGTRW